LEKYGIIKRNYFTEAWGISVDKELLIPIILLIVCITPIIWAQISTQRMSQEEREKRMQKIEQKRNEYIHRNDPPKTENSQVKCPYCGSTQIQMINRKWSPITGFLTNKVDRVCVNCKSKF
jgi:hypothetical protein